MSFDQRPQKIRVVADGKKARAAESNNVASGAAGAGGAGAAGSPSASTRDAGPVKGIRAIKGAPANGSARAQGDLQAATGDAGPSLNASGDTRLARGSWIIAAVVFAVGSAVGGAAAMAALFR